MNVKSQMCQGPVIGFRKHMNLTPVKHLDQNYHMEAMLGSQKLMKVHMIANYIAFNHIIHELLIT